jgi:8-oxo-dGTP pyrophosphatase MutT (NUDIX family)
VSAVEVYDAAGGVVVDGELALVLFRPSRNEVRLPKGHVEPGESHLEAAVREIGEESGFTDIEEICPLGTQVVKFTSERDGRPMGISRTEHGFLFNLRSKAEAPRGEEDLKFEPVWWPINDLVGLLTFPPEREWARRAIIALSERAGRDRTS